MSYSNGGKKNSQPQEREGNPAFGDNGEVEQLRSRVKELESAAAQRDTIDANRATKFELKDRLTRLLAEKIPSGNLFAARFDMAERFTAPEIDQIIDYLKDALPLERNLLEAYRGDIKSHRQFVERRRDLDAEALAKKALEPAPLKQPELDLKPVRVGTE